jgi:succinoglycan biosynthesis transport protein ExoP
LAQYDINLREYWRILKKRKLIVISFGVTLGFLTTLLAILRAPEPIYKTSTLIEFEQAPALEGVYSTNSSSDSDDIDTQMTVIKGYAVFQRVAEKMELIPHGAIRDDGQLTENVIPIIEGLQARVDVTREGWTSILKISATDKDPETAKKLANTVALTYQEVHGEDQLKLTNKRLQHIAEQLADARKRLRKSEDEFNRFSQENELISIDLQSESILVRRQQIQDELRSAQRDREELENIHRRLNLFAENASGSGQDFFSPTANTQYQNTHGELVELLLKRETLLKDFTPKHPEVTALSNQITETAQKMVVLLEIQITGFEKEELDLKKELERVDSKGKVLMDKKLEYDRLKRQVDREDEMTALLETEQQEALIRRSESPEEVKIVRPALLPIFPTNSPRLVTTGGTGVILGLVLGMVLGFIVETFDTSLGAIEDVEETLGTKVLGIVPQTDAKEIRSSFGEKHPDGLRETMENQSIYLVSHLVPQSMVAESFRALRTSVHFNNGEKKVKSIAIASTSPKEGKTVVAVNLALTMAQGGMKVLLVGSDLRKPTVDRVFGVELSPGLADVLMGNLPWRETVKTVMDMVMGKMSQTQVMTTPGLDNVHIITSGPKPPNPAELIECKAMNDFLEEAKEEYDMVIFDSPPILSTADAAILSAKVDGVLLVYRVGMVSRGLLKRATAQLEQVKCNIMGVILNGMRPEVSSDFQDLKSYNYYYAYGSDEQERNSGRHGKLWSFLKEKTNSGKKAVLEKKQSISQLKPFTKKSHIGLWGLILLAICSLVGGVLFQSGIIDPFRQSEDVGPVTGYRTKEMVKKEIPKRANEPASTVSLSIPKTGGRGVDSTANMSPPMESPPIEFKPSAAEVSSEIAPPTPSFDDKPDDLLDVKIISYPFSLQLGAFRDLNEAEKLIFTCKENGMSAYSSEVELANGVWYRVFVGYFEDRESAERFKKEYGLREAGVKYTKYANLVDTYSSFRELEEKILSLKNLGYFPYVIKDSDSDFRLLVGSYVTKEGAEKLFDSLKADGIVNQIIER